MKVYMLHTAESDLLQQSERARKQLRNAESRRQHVPSTSFATAPTKPINNDRYNESNSKGKQRAIDEDHNRVAEPDYKPIRPQRDEKLEIVHHLQPGPKEYRPNPSDPDWLTVEPNSGIRLK